VIGLKDGRYPVVVGGVLDVLAAARGQVSVAAGELGLSTARLVEFFRRDPRVWGQVNAMRQEFGHPPLR
jgi:hypothetical protein